MPLIAQLSDLHLLSGEDEQPRILRALVEALRREAPYAWQGLMNRYASDEVRLELRASGTRALRGAFASETDLGTGLQRPLPLAPDSTDDRAIVRYPDCPPRTLVRVYWPLELGSAGEARRRSER